MPLKNGFSRLSAHAVAPLQRHPPRWIRWPHPIVQLPFFSPVFGSTLPSLYSCSTGSPHTTLRFLPRPAEPGTPSQHLVRCSPSESSPTAARHRTQLPEAI